MATLERRQSRDQPAYEEGGVAAYGQNRVGLRCDQVVGRTRDPGEGVVQHLGINPAALVETQALGGAHEQREAQSVLERADVATDGALGDAELFRCLREAQMASRRLERTERIEGEKPTR
jgi:hypothetical protein